MDVELNFSVFGPVLSQEEWQTIPSETGQKILLFVNEKIEEFITSKALLETKCSNYEKCQSDLKEERDTFLTENDTLKARLEAANVSITELENQTSSLSSELVKLQEHVKSVEIEAANIRHQRNLAADERDEHIKMIQRRASQIERMQLDINALTKQLEDAVNTKCEALAHAEEVSSMKMTLEYKENRLEQEKTLMNQLVDSLKTELQKRTEELVNIRRDSNFRWVQLETKLVEKTQELAVANDQVKFITELNQNLTTRIEELSQKIQNQNETNSKMNESYICEIDAKTKLSNAYQTMYEESQQHAKELSEALTSVQELLNQATEQYGELETKHKESKLENEEIISKKNECIAMLKKELETANEILDHSKNELHMKDFGDSSASKLLKSGMSYTELYARYVNVNDQLAAKVEECTKLDNYISRIVKEVEEKAPSIRKIQLELNEAINSNETLKDSNDALLEELQQLRNSIAENERLEGKTRRDNERMKKEIADLSRQVVHLLEVGERLKNGSISNSVDNNSTDSLNSSDIISKWLVTFSDVSELQATNHKLLALVRELSERQEEAESYDPSSIADLKKQLDELRESQNEMLSDRDQQNKMMNLLRNQRDMYKNLYSQAVKGVEDPNASIDKSFAVAENGDVNKSHSDSVSLSNYNEKVHDLEGQVDKYKKQVQQIKDELDTYKKERLDHEKILLEQLESIRNESKEMAKLNGKLTSQAEYNEEHFKILSNNSEVLKKQISGLEKQNKIYSETVIKHEQAVSYLKNDLIQTQAKLSKAEVMLADLQKENDLLKDAEKRLVKENEMQKRYAHQNNLLHSNIELIKATLERNDAESKLRLETKLDEAHLECNSLRRRLEEEQNNFRSLCEHLEKQAKQARDRMEEEKNCAEKLRKELGEMREDLINKTNYIDELSKKLKSSVFAIPDCTVESRKLRELEQQYTDAKAEINTLKTRLKNSKDAADEYCHIAENEEKKVKDLCERELLLKEELQNDKKLIQELRDKCMELEGELSIQMDDQDIANANIKSRSEKLQEELNIRNIDLETAKKQLENNRSDLKSLSEQLKAVENKYAREVMLHSKDLQSLTDAKAELNDVISNLKLLESEKQQTIEASEQCKINLANENKMLRDERETLKARVKNIDEENNLLLDQIQQMNAQLTILQAQISGESQHNQSAHNTSLPSADSSLNRSLPEDEVRSSEQLLKIIKFMRQEKDIAINKADIVEAEHIRLKTEFEMVSKQLNEAKAQFNAERQLNESASLTAAKHAEVLRKLDTLNALTDSNRSLRQERDNLLAELTSMRSKSEQLESEVAPLQELNRDLKTKMEQMQAEGISLRGECNRWRQRANQLLEKSNRTSPEDWKKLQTERETLAKQLTVERGNTAKLNEDNNVLRQNNMKLEEQLKTLTSQNRNYSEELSSLKEQMTTLQTRVGQLSENLQTQQQNNDKVVEENRLLTEDTASKDVTITELKNNLAQVKKIAKKYKTQYEDQVKDIESLKQLNEQTQNEQSSSTEKHNQILEQQKIEHEEKMNQLESSHRETTDVLNQQILSAQEQVNNLKKEIEALKHNSQEKEDKFKTLFKNAKDRIVNLTEQNANLREELSSKKEKTDVNKEQTTQSSSSSSSNSGNTNSELLEKMNVLQQERDDLTDKMQQEKDSHSSEIESLNQRINLLERKLEQQQGSKPSTSSAGTEKPSTERPTADIKPMAGHSTNTQTQSISISPWRSGAETPLASIRPMSQQLRTAAVLPTTQTSSAVVPPQQQVHTTGSTSVEALSSSPTSSHTDYVLATSSANLAMLGPRQAAVPPSQSSEDDSNVQVQASPQQQTLAVISPRVEPPCSGSGATQEQGTSSSSSNTVTTTQAGLKRPRDSISDSQDQDQSKLQQKCKRTRLQPVATLSDSGADVEYQVPTSSQRDHDDDNVIVVESDEEADPDEGEGEDQEEDTEDYDTEAMDQDNYEDADCQDVETDEEGGNEVEFIEDSSEVPNQSETQESPEEESGEQQPQSQAISSGSDGQSRGVTISQASTSATSGSSFSRPRQVPTFPHRQPITGYSGLIDEGGMDDGIVPSTPTLFVPRRIDGFGEAVSSPHVPSSVGARFSFNESILTNIHNELQSSNRLSEAVPEHALDMSHPDENSTGRSVPTTPLQSSPQESIPNVTEDISDRQSDAEIPHPTVSGGDESRGGEGSSEDVLGVLGQAGTSSEEADRAEQIEGDDGVSSEGEKQPSTEDGEEEGREAEASPSTNSSRNRSLRGNSNLSNRRLAVRMSTAQRSSRQGPTPIVWGEGRPPAFRPIDRTRGSPPSFLPRTVARRARGRVHKQFGGRF